MVTSNTVTIKECQKNVTVRWQVFSKTNFVYTEFTFPVFYTAKANSVKTVVSLSLHWYCLITKTKFRYCKNKKFISSKVAHSKLQNSLGFALCPYFICVTKESVFKKVFSATSIKITL